MTNKIIGDFYENTLIIMLIMFISGFTPQNIMFLGHY